ncbi:hypothetical protein EDB89DRAFT_1531840 [Lactarius sanguifluus]|nr:hypothetical protein EDB89DRAFT_1531840 [Lactarius sanguifluus]
MTFAMPGSVLPFLLSHTSGPRSQKAQTRIRRVSRRGRGRWAGGPTIPNAALAFPPPRAYDHRYSSYPAGAQRSHVRSSSTCASSTGALRRRTASRLTSRACPRPRQLPRPRRTTIITVQEEGSTAKGNEYPRPRLCPRLYPQLHVLHLPLPLPLPRTKPPSVSCLPSLPPLQPQAHTSFLNLYKSSAARCSWDTPPSVARETHSDSSMAPP